MDTSRTKHVKPVFIKLGSLGRGRGQGLRSIVIHGGIGVSKTPSMDESTDAETHKDKFWETSNFLILLFYSAYFNVYATVVINVMLNNTCSYFNI